MKTRTWALALATAFLGLCARPALADKALPKPAEKKADRDIVYFGTLKAASLDVARDRARDWLKSAGKTDAATTKKFDAIWSSDDGRSVLDRVAASLALGDAEAAKLLETARDPNAPAPIEMPAILKDEKRPAFFRANLALAYGKALSNRRVFEEALEAFRLIKSEQVVDPGVYFFHRAVAEHALLLKEDAARSILAINEDVADAPDRYRLVSLLMLYDINTWKEKDLGGIARKMNNIERRLELARGGPQTQKIQKEVVARLDELIKEMENQNNDDSQANGGGCPGGCPGGQPGSAPGSGTNQPSSPMKDSNIATNGGPGNVDEKRLKGLAESWGKLPEHERAKAMAEMTHDMPPRYREVIEKYFKDLAKNQDKAAQP